MNGFLLAAALLTGGAAPTPATPQSGGRIRTIGRLVGPGGEPWAGAQVECFGSASSCDGTTRRGEWLSTRTDRRGRFRLSLLPGRSYQIWGWKADRDGYRATAVTTGIVAGRAIRLVGTERLRHRIRVRIEPPPKAFPWAGPYRFEVSIGDELHPVPGKIGEPFELPPLPATTPLRFRLCDGRGFPLLERALPAAVADGQLLEYRFPPVRRLSFQVTSLVSGLEPDGVVCSLGDGPRLWELGRTDARGRVSIDFPLSKRAGQGGAVSTLFLFHKPGLADTAFFVVYRDDGHGRQRLLLRPRRGGRVQVAMRRGFTLRGRLLDAERKPLAGAELVLHAIPAASGKTGWTGTTVASHVRTGGDGGFAISGLAAGAPYRLLAAAAVLPRGTDPSPLAPWIPLHARIGPPSPADEDLGDISCADLVFYRLEVRRAEGSPAAGAAVVLTERIAPRGTPFRMRPPIRVRADRKGRVTFASWHKNGFYAAARYDEGYGASELPAEKDLDGPVVIQIQAPIRLSGVVQNPAGRPVPGATVTLNPLRAMRLPQNLLLLNLWKNAVQSDADGRFRIAVPFPDDVYYVWARFRVGKRWFGSTGRRLVEVERSDVRLEPLVISLPAGIPAENKKKAPRPAPGGPGGRRR